MTTIKPLDDGVECIQVTMVDGENEVRIHLHEWGDLRGGLIGLVVKSAKLGLLYEEGQVVALECEG